LNEKGLAWEETEKGRFRDDYFSPVKIPVYRSMFHRLEKHCQYHQEFAKK